jgi:hypothetical protein
VTDQPPFGPRIRVDPTDKERRVSVVQGGDIDALLVEGLLRSLRAFSPMRRDPELIVSVSTSGSDATKFQHVDRRVGSSIDRPISWPTITCQGRHAAASRVSVPLVVIATDSYSRAPSPLVELEEGPDQVNGGGVGEPQRGDPAGPESGSGRRRRRARLLRQSERRGRSRGRS